MIKWTIIIQNICETLNQKLPLRVEVEPFIFYSSVYVSTYFEEWKRKMEVEKKMHSKSIVVEKPSSRKYAFYLTTFVNNNKTEIEKGKKYWTPLFASVRVYRPE